MYIYTVAMKQPLIFFIMVYSRSNSFVGISFNYLFDSEFNVWEVKCSTSNVILFKASSESLVLYGIRNFHILRCEGTTITEDGLI